MFLKTFCQSIWIHSHAILTTVGLTLDTDSVNLESTLIIDLEQDLTKTTKHHFFDRSVGRKAIPKR